jgi:thiamine-phosphate pyrophosphorylase
MLVTDRRRVRLGGGEALARTVDTVVRAAAAGVTLVQVRERGLDDRTLLTLVGKIVVAVAHLPTRVVVNERVDIALASDAHGVHLPADGISASRVREIVPGRFLIGRSVHSASDAQAAAKAGGCDYLVFGTVFSTVSKPATHPVAGVEGLAAACRAVDLPVLAIGGVTADRFRAVADAGAAGIAAIGLFIDTTAAQLAQDLARLNAAYALSA